ncbi:MAG: thymidylate synthase [Candidatus Magnetominusculus sp. LBB02]|nr:thymidylate synthase [Candidatus Magnetominusculus sp. LBB02]
MEFIPVYYKDSLTVVNTGGYIGVVTLWSKKQAVLEKFREAGVDLDPASSPIAAVGTLYGNGLKHLLANLLYNPQITSIIICGRDTGGSLKPLVGFFDSGVEKVVNFGVTCNRIIGTSRSLPEVLTPGLFKSYPDIIYIGPETGDDFKTKLLSYLNNLPTRLNNSDAVEPERIEVDLPEILPSYFPSNPRSHVIIKDTPLEAWKELVFCLDRFGHMVELKPDERRKELQNVKVIVENPVEEDNELLMPFGFSIDEMKEYQYRVMNDTIEKDYSYGNRIRAYFDVDALTACVEKLKKNHQNRRSFIVIWDPRTDLTEITRKSPCMATIFFRVYDDKLTLSATFRVHNAFDAWLKNLYALMALQRHVAEQTGIPIGAITVVSHFISINPDEGYEKLQMVINQHRRFKFEADPNGQFRFRVEDGQIVAEHIYNGEKINEYRARKAERIQYELKCDRAISDIGHAIFVGRQLEKAQRCLMTGETFKEDL